MPTFRHKRSGKIVEVADHDAHRYRGSNFERLVDADEKSTVNVDEVPAGSAADVLAWVGDDAVRRAAALSVEQSGKQRKTLIAKLGG